MATWCFGSGFGLSAGGTPPGRLNNCFTFSFQKPFLRAYKGKLYLAKIIVPVLISLGAGGLLSVPVSPMLQGLGMDPQLAYMLPVLGMIVILQIVQLVVFMWTPLAKRLITKRLTARGVSLEQLQGQRLMWGFRTQHEARSRS